MTGRDDGRRSLPDGGASPCACDVLRSDRAARVRRIRRGDRSSNDRPRAEVGAVERGRTAQWSDHGGGRGCNPCAVSFFPDERSISRRSPRLRWNTPSSESDKSCRCRRLARTQRLATRAEHLLHSSLVDRETPEECRTPNGERPTPNAERSERFVPVRPLLDGIRFGFSRGSRSLLPRPGAASGPAELKGLDERAWRTYRKRVSNGPIAQLVELRTFNP